MCKCTHITKCTAFMIHCETDVHTQTRYDLYYTDDLRSRTGKFFHTHLSISRMLILFHIQRKMCMWPRVMWWCARCMCVRNCCRIQQCCILCCIWQLFWFETTNCTWSTVMLLCYLITGTWLHTNTTLCYFLTIRCSFFTSDCKLNKHILFGN